MNHARRFGSLVFTIWLALGSGLVPLSVMAEEAGPPTIEVTGRAKRSAPPDIARFRVAIRSESKDAREAAGDNAKRSSAVLKAIEKSMGKDASATTEGYAVSPRYRWNDGQQILIGYQAHNAIRVEIAELDRVGSVTSAALDAGADEIVNLQFTLRNDTRLRSQALAAAAKAARSKGEAIARALDLQILRVLRVTESGGGAVPRPVMRQAMYSASAEDSQPPPIAPGPVEVDVQVGLLLEVTD